MFSKTLFLASVNFNKLFFNWLIIKSSSESFPNNISLEIFNDSNNEIVLNSNLLENYIRENYPNYKLIASTTKCSN